jgi:hypothetical protein
MRQTNKLFVYITLLILALPLSAHAAPEVESIFRTHTNYNSRVFSGTNALVNCRDASTKVRLSFLKPSVVAADLTLIEASCVSVGDNRILLVIAHEHPYAESLSTYRLAFSSNQYCLTSLSTLDTRLELGGMPPVYSYCEDGIANVVLADPVSRVLTEIDSWSAHLTYPACLRSAQSTAERLTAIGVQPLWIGCTSRSDGARNNRYYVRIPSIFPAGLSIQHLTGNIYSRYDACLEGVQNLEQNLLNKELTPTSSFCYAEDSMYREKVSYVTSVYNRVDTASGGPYITAVDCNRAREAMLVSLERRRRRVVHSFCESGPSPSYKIYHLPQQRLPI